MEVGGAVVHQVPRQVGLPRAERGRPEKSIYAVEELGLPKDDTTDLACSPESQVFFPPEAGVPPRDRLDGDRVVVLVGVAKVDPAAARPGQRGLDRQDRLGRASCPSGAHSRQYERPLDVEPIRPSKRRESVLKVVVAIGEREATLAQVERVHRALLFVRSDADEKTALIPSRWNCATTSMNPSTVRTASMVARSSKIGRIPNVARRFVSRAAVKNVPTWRCAGFPGS